MAHTDPTRHDLLVLARRRLAQGGVVLHGPAGIGKTFVLRSLLPTAARGIPILHTEPTSAEAELAFSSLADLLDSVADGVIEALPCPQRSAVRIVLCREPPGPDGPDPLALRLGVLAVLRALSAATPVHVAIDGAQWMDAAGAEVLAFAARRLDPTRVRVIVAETTDPPAGPIHGTRFCPGTPSELELPPLGLSETRDLLAHHDIDHDLDDDHDPDRPPDRSLPHWLSRQVYEASAGNPMYALELAGAVRRSARFPDRDQPLPVPDRLRRLLIARLEGLAPEARRLLLLAGAAARPTVGLLRIAVGLSYDARDARVAAADRAAEDLVRRTLADATSAGILDPHRDDGRLRFTQPLFAAALYADGSPEQRRAAHAALAALSGEPIDRARRLAPAAPGPNERVAATLMSAAEQARRRGMPEDAAALARLAVARTPDEHADRRCERCLDGAGHAYAAADFELARLTRVDDPESADGPLHTPSRALTPAEHRVAELVGDGATNREIAGRLFLSAKTVESTLTRVYRKLGIRSRAELIRLSLAPSEEPDSTGRGTPKHLPALRVTP